MAILHLFPQAIAQLLVAYNLLKSALSSLKNHMGLLVERSVRFHKGRLNDAQTLLSVMIVAVPYICIT